MGKRKRKNYTPTALKELEPEMKIVAQLSFRDILWKTGDLVSIIEDDEEYYAQVLLSYTIQALIWYTDKRYCSISICSTRL